MNPNRWAGLLILCLFTFQHVSAEEPKSIAGIYPTLTMYNNEGECGTGAVVPWANRLWVITYAPHQPMGSSDKLYEITPEYKQIIRAESVGGTPANRLIHTESQQLNIGPYFINKTGDVRVLKPSKIPGRLTGSARHLEDPKNKIYIATMEEGLYSVDVKTLDVKEHIIDGNAKSRKNQQPLGTGIYSKLPGYHGKGLYTGQGLLFYANNGEANAKARKDPTVPSGALASWNGKGDWKLIRRNQFTEITGPGGIHGNSQKSDPVWAMGWDPRSVILMLYDDGKWNTYRLPKGSHSYDGAHGWNTEWPRIRDIGQKDLLATMHGTFWKFPKTFSSKNSSGITPRSNYLKVVGDFAPWKNRVVFGCDDSAQKEFLNKRRFKAEFGAPTQSNSNLWFVQPETLDQLGPALGRGSVWLRDDVKKNGVSDPYLFAGYDYRTLAITHQTQKPVTFRIEIDKDGTNNWSTLRSVKVENHYFHIFPAETKGAWIRLVCEDNAKNVTVHFHYRNMDGRTTTNHDVFSPLVKVGGQPKTRGMIRSMGRRLGLSNGSDFYQLTDDLNWKKRDNTKDRETVLKAKQPTDPIKVDAGSVVVESGGKVYRLPKNDAYVGQSGRICREVATERDLFNYHGTFYELPAENAQGFAKIRPIATHNLLIEDYASHFGLLFLTGLNSKSNDRVIRSADGMATVWAGVIDDLWKLGKPRGEGGPWKDSKTKANQPSDAYLMTGYDNKKVTLSASDDCHLTLEVDIDGTGLWVPFKKFPLTANKSFSYTFPEGFSAYWVRVKTDKDTTATAWFVYE